MRSHIWTINAQEGPGSHEAWWYPFSRSNFVGIYGSDILGTMKEMLVFEKEDVPRDNS